jgi:PKHD-type hydroxylase
MPTSDVADPLADIEREDGDARGDWRDLIFIETTVMKPDECTALKRLFDRYVDAGRAEGAPNARRVEVWLGGRPYPRSGIDANTIVPEGTEKLASRISALIQVHNNNHWRFDIIPYPRMCVSSQVLLDWQAAGNRKMRWHSDYTADPRDKEQNFEVKIVAGIQLSDPADYDGGQLEIYSGSEIVRPALEQGDMVLYPNFLLHRRLPITRGCRLGLITLAYGPCWR